MKSRSKILCDHSVGMALSAIEIYNKPDFKQREQVFAVLMVAAWESLLKAKMLKDGKNRLQLLWVRIEKGRYKTKANGERFTIGLSEALKSVALPPKVAENVVFLQEVRDAAVHLTADSPALPALMFGLGTASIRNYAKLARDWFAVSFNDYNIYILPIGFAYPFHTLTAADLKKEPGDVARLLAAVAKAQGSGGADEGGFDLVCEITMAVVAAKKLTDDANLVAAVGGDGTPGVVVTKAVNALDKYPYRFTELMAKVQAAVPTAKQPEVFRVIDGEKMKANPNYAFYNFRSKADEKRGVTKSTPVIYNEDAVRYIVERLKAVDGK